MNSALLPDWWLVCERERNNACRVGRAAVIAFQLIVLAVNTFGFLFSASASSLKVELVSKFLHKNGTDLGSDRNVSSSGASNILKMSQWGSVVIQTSVRKSECNFATEQRKRKGRGK